MKIASVMTVLCSLLIASTSSAASIKEGPRSVLSQTFLDGVLLERNVGVVHVDTYDKEITLEIYEDPCGAMTADPSENVCLAVPMLLQTVRVPLLKSEVQCGSDVYSGFVDASVGDLPVYEVVVFDHTKRVCKDVVPAQIVVELKVTDVRNQTTQNYLLLK